MPEITWDDNLAVDAQQWADHLAGTSSFYHSENDRGNMTLTERARTSSWAPRTRTAISRWSACGSTRRNSTATA
ncbi:CAP domain-containing protein [Sphingomonas pruni]|uniref:CAP domain-containing protein n=1 Tax=Sphingomonas pruni TaxID=40683 RepID=UPI0034E1C454